MIKARIMVFTRDPSDTEQLGINGYHIELYLGGTAIMFRIGAIGLGYKGYRTGWNSEGIRHAFQNRFAHGVLKPQPWFRKLSGLNRFMIGTDYGSEFHNW